MKKNGTTGFVTVLVLIFLYSCNQAPKVYEWRGENRSGIYTEENVLESWPEEGPELVWEYEGIGNGYGSPIFTSDKMYIQGEQDSIAYLFAFNIDGDLLWKSDFGKEWVKNWNGSRSAPTIVDDLIYVTSGMGNVYCINRESGEKEWSVDMINDLNGEFPLFGYSEAVIIEDDLVFAWIQCQVLDGLFVQHLACCGVEDYLTVAFCDEVLACFKFEWDRACDRPDLEVGVLN